MFGFVQAAWWCQVNRYTHTDLTSANVSGSPRVHVTQIANGSRYVLLRFAHKADMFLRTVPPRQSELNRQVLTSELFVPVREPNFSQGVGRRCVVTLCLVILRSWLATTRPKSCARVEHTSSEHWLVFRCCCRAVEVVLEILQSQLGSAEISPRGRERVLLRFVDHSMVRQRRLDFGR